MALKLQLMRQLGKFVGHLSRYYLFPLMIANMIMSVRTGYLYHTIYQIHTNIIEISIRGNWSLCYNESILN